MHYVCTRSSVIVLKCKKKSNHQNRKMIKREREKKNIYKYCEIMIVKYKIRKLVHGS